jgi:threonine/homoserine/homoserine lactone efflux protein
MFDSLFFKGIGVGLTVAMPIGPVAVLCMRTAMTRGLIAGLAFVAGTVFADSIYAAIGAFGLTSISGFLISYQHLLGMLGGLILIWIGYNSLCSKPHVELRGRHSNKAGLFTIFLQSIGFTLSCPSTIVLFSSQFATAQQIFTTPGLQANLALISGVAVSVATWFTFVVVAVNILRSRVDNALRKLNIMSGIVIGLLGIKFVSTHLMAMLAK